MNLDKFKISHDAIMHKLNEIMNDSNREVIEDGVMKPEIYFNKKIRISWMLKEPYDEPDGSGGGWKYEELFTDNIDLYENQFNRPHKTTWHPIIYTTYAIKNNFLNWNSMEYIRDKHEMCDILRETAFVNIQKLPSQTYTHTENNTLIHAIKKTGDLLKQQIELLNPNVLIFANTFTHYLKLLNLDSEKKYNHGTCDYVFNKGKLYIDAYHPAQRTVSRERYTNDIVQLVKKFELELK